MIRLCLLCILCVDSLSLFGFVHCLRFIKLVCGLTLVLGRLGVGASQFDELLVGGLSDFELIYGPV